MSIKINGHKDFTQSEIFTMIHCYGLTPEQVFDIFFSIDDKVVKNSKASEVIEADVTNNENK